MKCTSGWMVLVLVAGLALVGASGLEAQQCDPTEEQEFTCNDEVDNDCDRFIDCGDPDCAFKPGCEQCEDQDGDGFPGISEACPFSNDCDDLTPLVNPLADEICDDNQDNDCDGLKDCDDSDCQGDPACQQCDITEVTEVSCGDNQDNDCDGFIDCEDQDCLIDADGDNDFAAPCGGDCDDLNPEINQFAAEICEDAVDNDCDLHTDCEDPDCEADPVCQEPTCELGGSAGCLSVTQVTCYNRSTRRRVTFAPEATSWDCVAEGLVVSSGNRVTQYIYGTASCEPVTGDACGETPSYLQCLNLDDGTRGYPPVAGSWDCNDAGMLSSDGQRVRMTVDGTAD